MQILMAPLEGVTLRGFRMCYYRHFTALDGALTPFLPIPDRAGVIKGKNLASLNFPSDTAVPEIPQVLCSESSVIIKTAAVLEYAGFREINWNLGCPSRAVVRKGKGAGLLPHPGKICGILDQVLPRLGIPLSIKLRLGLESEEDVFALLPHLAAYPLKRVILHPRTGRQMYKGEPDMPAFGHAMALYGGALYYNGDIRSPDDFMRLYRTFPGIKGWMIGRGLVGDPFLPEAISRQLSLDAQEKLPGKEQGHPLAKGRFRTFLDDLWNTMEEEFHNKKGLLGYMKGVLSYSFMNLPEIFSFELQRMENRKDWEKLEQDVLDFLSK